MAMGAPEVAGPRRRVPNSQGPWRGVPDVVRAYLLSSDTDLVPAVEEVQRLGKTVQYVGTPKGQSYGLSKIADDVRLLRPEDVAPLFAVPRREGEA
jgi:uncharacterized LabA/DUF88 family protein